MYDYVTYRHTVNSISWSLLYQPRIRCPGMPWATALTLKLSRLSNPGDQGTDRNDNGCITRWWLTYPSEKHESVGMMTFPVYGKIKNVPDHQPD